MLLTGLASSMAEKAGSQLLLNVLLAYWRLLPLTLSFSLAEIALTFYSKQQMQYTKNNFTFSSERDC